MSSTLGNSSTLEQGKISMSGAESASNEVVYYDDGLLVTAGPIIVICYLLLFAIAVLTFMSSGDALFAVVISIVFAIVFFAIPLLFLKIRAARDRRWLRDPRVAESPIVEIWTGSMHRWEGIVQIVSIPLAILMGFTLLAIRWSLL